MSDLTNDERETHISCTAANRGMWEVYTDDPVWIARLEKLGFISAKTLKSGGKYFELPDNQLTIRRKRVLSREQRAELRERAKRMREAQP